MIDNKGYTHPGALVDAEGTEQLPLVPNRHDPAEPRHRRQKLARDRDARRCRPVARWPGGGGCDAITEPDPHIGPRCAGAFAQYAGHPRENVLTRVGAGDALASRTATQPGPLSAQAMSTMSARAMFSSRATLRTVRESFE